MKRNSSFKRDRLKGALLGVAIGDALGVPVEFKSRSELNSNPVTGMRGFGTHNQPPGTWSDDSSLSFCLAEALTEGMRMDAIGNNFIKWYKEGYWSARGNVFDIGRTTLQAIERLLNGTGPEFSGNTEEASNGNGALMRILPLLFSLDDKSVNERYIAVRDVSSITHRHQRSVIACFCYIEFARNIYYGIGKFESYNTLKYHFALYVKKLALQKDEASCFNRLILSDISALSTECINSSGYVLDTLEASIWCILTTNSFREAVLKAVNLGGDSDTTGAVTGGLAGLLYGINGIPKAWKTQIARYRDIEDLAIRLNNQLA